jgi:hypothetical protein
MNREHSTVRLPDFIIIGAMKSATSSLQKQLLEQRGIFMCTPKEPNFFSDDDQYSKGMGWYSGLFSTAPEASLLGEASTHYTKLPTHPKAITRLKEHLPNARFVYVMRHPVDRLVSHYMHEWSTGVYRCGIEEAVDKYPELITYGCYSMQLDPYLEAFGHDAVLPVFFDHLLHEPQAELERICQFIGYQGQPVWVKDIARQCSSERVQFSLSPFSNPHPTWLRCHFIPQGMRDAIKMKFRMQECLILASNFGLNYVHFDRSGTAGKRIGQT